MSCLVCQLPIAEPVRSSGPPSSSRKCPFCSAIFSRVDGAKRHAKCCPQREGRTIHARKRGRKTQSCDQCSRVKVHCNARDQHSCGRCVSRKLDCTFSRCCADASHRKKPPGSGSPSHGRVSLSFLLNFTDEKQDYITERAVGEEPEGALLGPTCSMTSPSPTPKTNISTYDTLDYINPALLFSSDSHTSLMPLEMERLYDTEEQNLLGAFLAPWPQESRLSARLHLLELDVSAHASSSNLGKDYFDLVVFRRLFSVSNVHTFAKMFCRKRHYQYPVTHWPTFSLDEVSLPLLLVVSLTGATYSYRPGYGPEHIVEARRLYHLADSYVFHRLETYLERPPPDADFAEAVQLCQAALLMYALDTLLAADLDMQHKAMAERLPALISAMRKLRFIGCRHDSSEDWQLFLHRERIIRLVSWAFCADCLATLSCNNPPIFSVLEMSGDIPCDPDLWDTDAACTFESRKRASENVSMNLKDLMSRMFNDDVKVISDWETLPLFHLHIMLCALQQTIFNLHVAMVLEAQSEKLVYALGTWRHLWERSLGKIPQHRRKWLGVATNLSDIEYLSRRIIEVATGPEAGSSRYLQRVPSYSARDIHEFIRGFILDS